MVIDFSSFYDFPKEVDRLLEGLLRPGFYSTQRYGYPPVNLSEDEDNIYVRAEIPGLKVDDVELTLGDGSLVIRGERNPGQGKYFRRERPTGAFQRIVGINVPVDRDKVKAAMKDGVLEVTLAKAEEVKPRKIAIETA